MSKKDNFIDHFDKIYNETNSRTYIYLDSTLPFSILNKKKYKKNLIFLARKNHLVNILDKFYIKKNKSINVSGYMFLKLIYILLKIKILNSRIIFFHECCNPLFDSLINLLKIKGLYIPIASPLKMEKGYNHPPYQVKLLPFKKKILYFILSFLLKYFKFYMRKNSHGVPVLYFVMKKYNKNIKVQKKKITKTLKTNKSKIIKKKLLIFLSKVPSCDNEDYNARMINSFHKIINFCNKNKIFVYIKDHPNKSSRLKLKNKNLVRINPNKPAELIKYEDFDLFISLTSNSLCSFDKKAVSIVNLISNKKKVIKFYKQPFLNRGLKGIKYPKSYNDLYRVILKK